MGTFIGHVVLAVSLLGAAAFATPARTHLERHGARALAHGSVPATTAALLAQLDTRAGEAREATPSDVFTEIFVPAKATADSMDRSLGRSELPEPAVFALIGSGLLLLGIIRRRRQA